MFVYDDIRIYIFDLLSATVATASPTRLPSSLTGLRVTGEKKCIWFLLEESVDRDRPDD